MKINKEKIESIAWKVGGILVSVYFALVAVGMVMVNTLERGTELYQLVAHIVSILGMIGGLVGGTIAFGAFAIFVIALVIATNPN